MKQLLSNLDFWGFTTSMACAVHCAVLPVILSLGLLGSFGWMTHPVFEVAVISLSFWFVSRSIFRKYFLYKCNLRSVLMAIAGILLIALHHVVEIYVTPMVVSGGILIAFAHLFNLYSPTPSRSA